MKRPCGVPIDESGNHDQTRDKMKMMEPVEWIGKPGVYHWGCDTVESAEWITADEAAKELNVSVREIRERYARTMLDHFPNSIIDKRYEWEYEYDFEADDYTFDDYGPREHWTVDYYGDRFDCYPEMKPGFIPDEDEDSDALMLTLDKERGFDRGLEPRYRRKVQTDERLYKKSALMWVREEQLKRRAERRPHPRGAGGRFVKKGK